MLRPADEVVGGFPLALEQEVGLDTKFSQLHLASGGELGNSGSAPAYKVQLHLYNRMLGRLQGYTPPESFVLGRGWGQTRRKVGLLPESWSTRNASFRARSGHGEERAVPRKRCTEEQIGLALRQAEAGTPVTAICRKLGITEPTFYRWQRRH